MEGTMADTTETEVGVLEVSAPRPFAEPENQEGEVYTFPAPSSALAVTSSRYCGWPCSRRNLATASTSPSETKGPCRRVIRPPPAM